MHYMNFHRVTYPFLLTTPIPKLGRREKGGEGQKRHLVYSALQYVIGASSLLLEDRVRSLSGCSRLLRAQPADQKAVDLLVQQKAPAPWFGPDYRKTHLGTALAYQ